MLQLTGRSDNLLRMLRGQPMKHSAKKSCASIAQKHETQMDADVCRDLKQFDATLNARRLYDVSPDIKLHVITFLMEVFHHGGRCITM